MKVWIGILESLGSGARAHEPKPIKARISLHEVLVIDVADGVDGVGHTRWKLAVPGTFTPESLCKALAGAGSDVEPAPAEEGVSS